VYLSDENFFGFRWKVEHGGQNMIFRVYFALFCLLLATDQDGLFFGHHRIVDILVLAFEVSHQILGVTTCHVEVACLAGALPRLFVIYEVFRHWIRVPF